MRGLWSLDGGQLFGVNYVRQSPESGMAKLRTSMSVEEFDDGYFYAADLKAFCHETCGTGGTALVHCLPRRSGNAVFIIDSIRCGAGILMRCLSGSTGRPIIYGALWITKAKW